MSKCRRELPPEEKTPKASPSLPPLSPLSSPRLPPLSPPLSITSNSKCVTSTPPALGPRRAGGEKGSGGLPGRSLRSGGGGGKKKGKKKKKNLTDCFSFF